MEMKYMKARILDPQVKVYSSLDENAISIATLQEGNEIEFGTAKKRAGKLWVPITLSTGQLAYIPGDTHIFAIREGFLMQSTADVHAEPSAESAVTQQLGSNAKFYILQRVSENGQIWMRIRDMKGSEGFIFGDTRIRVTQIKTKAAGMKNVVSGVMWLVVGILLNFSGIAASSGGSFRILGYGAILFGGVMLISGLIQYFTAQA
jgi:hypothetical protein